MKLTKFDVEVDDDGYLFDVTFYFDNKPEPFSVREFTSGSRTRINLTNIIDSVERTLANIEEGQQ